MIVKIFQLLCYFIVFVPFRFFLRLRSNFKRDDIPKGTIIICNHQGKLDPFLVCSAIPLRTFIKITPICFPVTIKQMNGLQGIFLRLVGAVPVHEQKSKDVVTLLKIINHLERGKSVFMFPEGRITKEKDTAKKGIGFISSQNLAPILPVHIDGSFNLNLLNLILLRKKVNVRVGNIITARKVTANDLQQYSEFLMEKVYSLEKPTA